MLGRVRSVGTPIALGGFRPRYRPGSRLGADNAALLEELGYDEDALRRLAEAGAFGPALSVTREPARDAPNA